MSELQTYLRTRLAAFDLPVDGFILRNGRGFTIDELTFSGARMTQGECYRNAAMLAQRYDCFTYVEGYVAALIPIPHAWVALPDGSVVDPTLGGDTSRVTEYFGVEFSTRYLNQCLVKNGRYGLLDQFYCRKTIGPLLNGRAKFSPSKKEPTPCQ